MFFGAFRSYISGFLFITKVIEQILIIQKGDEVPPDFELLLHSHTLRIEAEINRGGISTMIAIRRTKIRPTTFLYGFPIIDDLYFVNISQGEEVPEGYSLIDKNLNRGTQANTLMLAFRQLPGVGLCDIGFKAETIDRFPKTVIYFLNLLLKY